MEDISKEVFINFMDINWVNWVINIDYLVKDTIETLLNFKEEFNYYKVINN